MSTLDVRIEWLDAPSVTTPELAATWARYEIWVGDACVTQVEASDGTFRRSVYGSLYPLAEWIAMNWWVVNHHIRPSAVETLYWNWVNVRRYPWLRSHNLRAAGNGMPWPNMTVVPEGSVCRIVWRSDHHRSLQPIRFASSGTDVVPARALSASLAGFVNRVLERLAENGIPKTRLADEWHLIARLDTEERDFCATVAQLGVDPFDASEGLASDVIRIADLLPSDLRTDFFDSAIPTELSQAAEWTGDAVERVGGVSAKADQDLSQLYEITSEIRAIADTAERPWVVGYSLARLVRQELGHGATDRFDPLPWVGVGTTSSASGGIHGLAAVRTSRCGLILGNTSTGKRTKRFRAAQAVGRAITRPDHARFLISSAHRSDERIARAFAAELLAPAAGIQELLPQAQGELDTALEKIALTFDVSPFTIRHQYDNQLAGLVDSD